MPFLQDPPLLLADSHSGIHSNSRDTNGNRSKEEIYLEADRDKGFGVDCFLMSFDFSNFLPITC
jgi:hypothetical protein